MLLHLVWVDSLLLFSQLIVKCKLMLQKEKLEPVARISLFARKDKIMGNVNENHEACQYSSEYATLPFFHLDLESDQSFTYAVPVHATEFPTIQSTSANSTRYQTLFCFLPPPQPLTYLKQRLVTFFYWGFHPYPFSPLKKYFLYLMGKKVFYSLGQIKQPCQPSSLCYFPIL